MLKPKYIERLPDAMVELYSQVEQDILNDMARRISTYDYWIPAAEHQRRALIEMGNFHSYVIKALSARTGKTTWELMRLMEEAGEKSLAFDVGVYRDHGLEPPPLAASKELQAVLRSGLKQTKGLFKNLTRTTANTASKQFEDALDRAWLQVTSGAFDSGAAIRAAVKELSRQGVGAVRYPSGHTDTLEVAVRRAVVTGVNQTCGKLQLELADELGCDLMELTAHAGARPSHAAWQGQIVSRSGRKGYLSLSDIGYGSGDGFKGWNCRHDWNPWFEDMPRAYTPDTLKSYEARDYTYNGQKMTEYEATQKQRYTERQIRRWKRENAAMAAAGLDTSESAAKLRQWQDTQRDFLRQTGLKRQSGREQAAGTGMARGTVLGKAKYAKDVPESVRDSIEKELEGLPPKVRASAEKRVSGIRVSGTGGSGYNTRTEEIILGEDRAPGDVIHEYGHALEKELGVYEDPDFLEIRAAGLEKVSISDIIEDDKTFTQPIFRVSSPKLVSEYQGRLYEQYGIYDGTHISLDGMREYFSEGFRVYITQPELLKSKDPRLFQYLEDKLNG